MTRARLPGRFHNGGERVDTSRLCCDGRCGQGRDCPLRRTGPVTQPTSPLWWVAAVVLLVLVSVGVEISCRAGCW